ncbi:hypothetical protein ABTF02_13315 [Acinetobacter baumannii]|uniref:hypothetical protein n=1 Tax=Acinetobacter pittii TaxID=48296 RepID=UPI000992E72A|nr:hypothetical protein [Acinetobacter pittii]TDM66536.1 hypothetical protein C5B72_03240 [Acinetobacter sp. KU 011TH]TDM67371.1 hypothetical protein C4608_03240 [Acinetobacter sp. KU 013TH]MCZ1176817.1 hypothetical protein [Acinetobacter pittii]OOT53151.1 hypothetical protein BTG92_08930 [Acinetobacter pittii]OTU65076.1 hypothetical protein CAT31_16700 [Acinetobacter pittii]
MTNTLQESSTNPIKYEVINNFPEKQSLALQNTDVKNPIQLRIDPVTDYWALFFTIFASVLISTITAAVTIWLIKISNNSLAQSQANLQDKMLSQQADLKKAELKAQNRQEWINNVRKLFVNYFNHSSSYAALLQRNYAVRHAYCKQALTDKQQNEAALEYQNYLYELKRFSLEIDITLSASDEIDREISNLVNSFYEKFKALVQHLDQEFRSTGAYQEHSKGIEHFEDHSISQEMNTINLKILSKVKILLKNEWEKVKSFD